MSAPRRVAIIGAGVTGLSAAYHLHRAGAAVRVFERSDRVGGPVHSTRDGDWLVESGPNSIQESSTELTRLIQDIGLDEVRSPAQAAARNRYILRNGRPVAAPSSPPGILTSSLFSLGGKFRLFGEVLKRPRVRRSDVNLADFVRSHFGDDIVDYGLNPFVSGVYAGDPEKLSAKHAFPSLWKMERETGSIIRGQIKAAKQRRASGESAGPPAIISFQDGLGMLPLALAKQLPPDAIELGASVNSLVRSADGWKLVWNRSEQTQTESFDRVLLALPAAALARLSIGSLGECPLAALADIDYPPVSALFLGYRREQVSHPLDGFGLLMPQKEHRQILGVLFSSSLFAGRAPAGHVGLTVMMGGVHRRDLGTASQEQLTKIARAELAAVIGVTGEPVYARLRQWPRAIPQYTLGYERYVKAMEQCENQHSGLLIGGHVRDGISLPNCLSAGAKLARRALA
ncbi:protoporphyrinogen oxidase [Synoicihabitans lomoniglobus]|uniref:Coproporphyrinogen III oxidase n=1 Tax=Synoicihabitans lomoniglobus TaxID=2909285 RepID=A0AAF0CQL5_9BACT|nr:protoporphyrinogen oxidase [Opitutaceae bacterium LMO-M01]WED66264.1 protoporphyrinogen oxidase [Opitutaceae bacterium LMO-M01]